jgi:hypothetical protein
MEKHMSFKKYITIKWHIEDVLSVNPNLTEKQASDVLQYVERNHDAEIGINWDVIEIACDTLFPESN